MSNGFHDITSFLDTIAKRLNDQMPGLIETQVMAEAMAEHKYRIYDRGKTSDGSPIGEYSTGPAYYGPKAFVKKGAFKPRGKENSGDFKNGKKRKSMFFATGYSGLREEQNRQTDFKNLKYSGNTERSMNIVKDGNSVFYGVTNKEASKLFEAHNEQYDNVYYLSESEKQIIEDGITDAGKSIANK